MDDYDELPELESTPLWRFLLAVAAIVVLLAAVEWASVAVAGLTVR